VDDPAVNAFALPGGFIYVTRGILAHLDSEAELAGVLGHEIGHVTARHSASQISRSQLAQVGLGVGAILAPEDVRPFLGLAQSGLGLLLLKHSRDAEREADSLGVRYMTQTGSPPAALLDVFGVLAGVSAASGGSRLPGWLSTHPTPEDRQQRIGAELAALPDEARNAPRRREELLARLDGIVYGEDPREGFFVDSRFVHPTLRFELRYHLSRAVTWLFFAVLFLLALFAISTEAVSTGETGLVRRNSPYVLTQLTMILVAIGDGPPEAVGTMARPAPRRSTENRGNGTIYVKSL